MPEMLEVSPKQGVQAWVDCVLLEDRGTDAFVVIENLPAYRADAPFLVSRTDLRDDQRAACARLRRTDGPNYVVDMPGEPLSFGPRLLIPAERVHLVGG